MSTTPSSVFRVQHNTDPADDIRKSVGDISGISVGPGKLLLGIYKRPEKIGSIIRVDSSKDEDVFQGKVWVVLSEGPLCFTDTDDGAFGGFRPKVGDWVLARNNDGYRFDLGSSQSDGHPCLIIQDRYIKAVVPVPSNIW